MGLSVCQRTYWHMEHVILIETLEHVILIETLNNFTRNQDFTRENFSIEISFACPKGDLSTVGLAINNRHHLGHF